MFILGNNNKMKSYLLIALVSVLHAFVYTANFKLEDWLKIDDIQPVAAQTETEATTPPWTSCYSNSIGQITNSSLVPDPFKPGDTVSVAGTMVFSKDVDASMSGAKVDLKIDGLDFFTDCLEFCDIWTRLANTTSCTIKANTVYKLGGSAQIPPAAPPGSYDGTLNITSGQECSGTEVIFCGEAKFKFEIY